MGFRGGLSNRLNERVDEDLFRDRPVPVAEYNTSPVGMDIRDRNRNSFWARFACLRPRRTRPPACDGTHPTARRPRPPLLRRPFIRDEVRVGRGRERERGRERGERERGQET